MSTYTPAVSIRRLGISHGEASFDLDSKQWVHFKRPPWFEGRPVLQSSSLDELKRRVTQEGELLYGIAQQVGEVKPHTPAPSFPCESEFRMTQPSFYPEEQDGESSLSIPQSRKWPAESE